MTTKINLPNFLDEVKSKLNIPYLYRMDINCYDDFGRIDPIITICWRQWVEYSKQSESVILKSRRYCVQFAKKQLCQTKFPIDVVTAAIRRKVEDFPEPLNGKNVEWTQLNKSIVSLIRFPL